MFTKLLDNIGSSSKYIKRFKKSAKIKKCGICVQNSFSDALVIPMLRPKVKKCFGSPFLKMQFIGNNVLNQIQTIHLPRYKWKGK